MIIYWSTQAMSECWMRFYHLELAKLCYPWPSRDDYKRWNQLKLLLFRWQLYEFSELKDLPVYDVFAGGPRIGRLNKFLCPTLQAYTHSNDTQFSIVMNSLVVLVQEMRI